MVDSAADLARRIENIVRAGTIAEVQYKPLRVRVATGNLRTDWLTCFVSRAGDVLTWSPPFLGEQCIVFSPGGDMASGMVLVGLNSDLFSEPEESPTVDARHYPDGAVVRYDHGTHALNVSLPAGGTADITAPASVVVHSAAITLDAADTLVTGTLTVQQLFTYQAGMAGTGSVGGGASAVITGGIRTTEDIVAGDISVQGHHHEDEDGPTGPALP